VGVERRRWSGKKKKEGQGGKRSRWEVEEEEVEEEAEKVVQGRFKMGKEQGGKEKKRVQWREVIDDLAFFDDREMVGVIHRESEHGLKGSGGVSVLELRRRQVRRKGMRVRCGPGREGGREGECHGMLHNHELITICLPSLSLLHAYMYVCVRVCISPCIALPYIRPSLSSLLSFVLASLLPPMSYRIF